MLRSWNKCCDWFGYSFCLLISVICAFLTERFIKSLLVLYCHAVIIGFYYETSWVKLYRAYGYFCLLLLFLSIFMPSPIHEIILIIVTEAATIYDGLAFKICTVDILHASLVLFECYEWSSTHKNCGVFLFYFPGTCPCWLFSNISEIYDVDILIAQKNCTQNLHCWHFAHIDGIFGCCECVEHEKTVMCSFLHFRYLTLLTFPSCEIICSTEIAGIVKTYLMIEAWIF